MASVGREKLKKYAIQQGPDCWWVRPPYGMYLRADNFEAAVAWARAHYELKRRRK